MDNANVQMGIDFFKSGNKPRALQIFLEVLKKEPKNEIAWLWLATCVEKPEQKRDCFHKILAINPNNTYAQKALAELELQIISDPQPILQNGTVLKCPCTCLAFKVVHGEVAKGKERLAGSSGLSVWMDTPSPNCWS